MSTSPDTSATPAGGPPLVSVIIPTYNMERYLAQTLESVCAQTYRNLEILVVDDGSKDGSAAIAREFEKRDPRVRLLSKPNGGLSSARNFGTDHSSGEYIGYVDADDYWDPTKVAKHVAHLEANPEVGVSYSGTQFFHADGHLLHRRFPKMRNLSDYYLYCRNPITNGSNAFFRREVMLEHRFDESKRRGHEDVDCWMRIAFTPPRKWRFEGIPEALTFYRVTPGSMSDEYDKHHGEAQNSWKKSFEYAPDVAAKYARLAEAFQLRFYARRAIAARNGKEARRNLFKAIRTDPRILFHEGLTTFVTLAASLIPLPRKKS